MRDYYAELFHWEFDTNSPVAQEVSDAGNYGFINRNTTPEGVGIPGGVGGGPAYESHAIFYVGVPNVGAALAKAESMGGKRVMGPARNPGGHLVVAHFSDPEATLSDLPGPSNFVTKRDASEAGAIATASPFGEARSRLLYCNSLEPSARIRFSV